MLVNIDQNDVFMFKVVDTKDKTISENSYTVFDLDNKVFCKCKVLISDNRCIVMWKSPAIARKKKRKFSIDYRN